MANKTATVRINLLSLIAGCTLNTERLVIKVINIFDKTLDLLTGIAAVLIVFMMLGVVTDISLRTFLNLPIPWMIEVVEYSILWVVFLCAAWVLRKEGHVRMDIFLVRLKPRTQSLLNFVTSILCIGVCAVLIWYSVQNTYSYMQTGFVLPTARRFPITPIFIIIPVGSFLLLIQCIRRAYGYFETWWSIVREKEKVRS